MMTKRLIVGIILFISSISFSLACGYYPYGEDVRFSLFYPKYFNYYEYSRFNYNFYRWGFDYFLENTEEKEDNTENDNIQDWYNYCNQKVPISSIVQFNYVYSYSNFSVNSSNEFISYFFQKRDTATLNYLCYAKLCETYNQSYENNNWEKESAVEKKNIAQFYEELTKAYKFEKNKYLKRKYAFQLIRFAYYNGFKKDIKQLFKANFSSKNKDYLYYWSSFFYCLTNKQNGNFNMIADIFANNKEKAFASQFYFASEFDYKKAISYAKTADEKANVNAYYAARCVDKSLDNLKIIYVNKPNNRILDFLLLREINKIEDWVYTPYYSNFSPCLEESYSFWIENNHSRITTQTLRNRSEKDRKYAQDVLDFVNTVSLKKVKNKELWEAAKIQLLFITRHFEEAVVFIDKFTAKYTESRVKTEVLQIKALCLVGIQKDNCAKITPEIYAIIMQNKNNNQFLFALGRELEYKKNLLDGIALLSMLKNTEYNSMEWRGNRLSNTENLDVFYNYFDYVDFVYSAIDLNKIIHTLKETNNDSLKLNIYYQLLSDTNFLTDLLGTKYIREEQLENALFTFQSLGETYWQNNYNAWERDKFDATLEFDKNPFYTIKYTEDFIPHDEHYWVNKLSVTQHLLEYIKRANNSTEINRAYYYFLVANCYLNMTDIGHCWMMRRFNSSSSYSEEFINQSYIDNVEYRTRNKTIEYYKLAYKYAKSDKFKALCLHMISFAQNHQDNDAELKKRYPMYFDDISTCYSLNEYFSSM